MCMLFVYFCNDPSSEDGYSVIIASNRDEVITKPTLSANFWSDYSDCIGGIDEMGGGTWLGVSKRERIGVLLNISCEPDLTKPTRGTLVKDFVTGSDDSCVYLEKCSKKRANYNPYHLILLEKENKIWRSFYQNKEMEIPFLNLQPGYHVFGNCPDNKPWKKIEYGRKLFQNIVEKYNNVKQRDDLKAQLLNMLSDSKKNLPDQALYNQLSHVKDPSCYSSIRVKIPESSYGTRTHTIVLVDKKGNFHYEEKTMTEPIDLQNPNWITSHFDF
ncbi:unnamed protein product [Dimorphilus gyrociliatus]|uniref:Uncharacterized protein n=1 Tax=Dimorphilus gyrociliatus TaxID=2664684 RepID=A0A7I8V884_9ANNE|nr:unnamed protein product [Dimorphilus gyrociliatus]